ncbi:WD40 repeat-like protein [Rhodocollybia butyracea]|uniref:WD40 repeat-like protein n=1 Tax=Rhodocollybia butyracea TaxID=206335 RepID=A0A9P5UEL5_9AGAR|nr:WD40 repeat-like protein [Rhodocollybia butyracea]
MRVVHTSHRLPAFPVYSSAFISPNELVIGGGGGATQSGIKNKLRIFNVDENRSISQQDEFELAKGEDAPMSMATHAKTIVCGVNSAPEQLEKGENENCRVFGVENGKISSIRTRGTLDVGPENPDYQKVTILSSDGSLLVVAGPYELSLLSYPSLAPVAQTIKTDKEIYDATFTKSQLIVATTANLQIFSLPNPSTITASASPSKSKKKGKQKAGPISSTLPILVCDRVVDIPPSIGGPSGSSFRAVKIHPTLPNVLFTVVNTILSRSRGKSTPRQAYLAKWNTENWTIEKSRKVGDRGITCFTISPDGKLLGYGSSDLSVGLLDASTLNPVSAILKAHEFPPTTLAFNTTSTILVSGSADNSIRVISVPAQVRGSNWSFIVLLVLTLIVVLLALAMQRYTNLMG